MRKWARNFAFARHAVTVRVARRPRNESHHAFFHTETTRSFIQIADKDWKTRLFNQKIRKKS